jgi:tetratricopeptide (TPR) repeat protein
MSALAKTKKQAAQLEHERQYDKALALYTRLLDESPDPDDEIDVALYNRAGDVALRAGDLPRAVTYYERALDLYAAGGFLNNAIALGAKILRQAPERAATHYTLGVLHAKKGFRSDARQHFLTYAERMHRAAQGGEVARSLADYVVLCDGASDARRGLDAHLAAGAARPAEVTARLHELLDQALRAAGQWTEDEPEDDAREAAPARPAGATGGAGGGSLVFLDLDAAAMAPDDDDEGDSAPMVTLDLLPAVDEPAPGGWVDAPLAALPGELPPLAPSMVALEVGDDEIDEWGSNDAELTGVPVFVELESEVELDVDVDVAVDVATDLTAGLPLLDEPAYADEPTFADAPVVPEELTLDDLAIDEPTPATAAALDLELLGDEPVVADAAPTPAPPAAPPAATSDADGLDLGAWLRESEPVRSTRLVAPVLPATGDEQADFQATLDAFKAGIARSLEDADFDAHYDLGVAYKEMGLLEEAIGEFQKAARAPGRPLRALEALASCFLEREQPELVLSTLAPVAAGLTGAAPGGDQAPQQVAVCYLLGAASEAVGRTEDARAWYLRVLATDYAFRDAAARLASLSPPPR